MGVAPGGWGSRSLLRSVAEHKWLNSMVYGSYNELVNGGYQPTNITGG